MTTFGSARVYIGSAFYGDVTGPILDITSTAFTSNGLISTSPVSFTATFTEPVTNFTVGDISVTGGTANTFAGSGTTYTFNVVPSASSVLISVANGAAWDLSGNDITGDSYAFTYDNSQPSLIISSTNVSNGGATPSIITSFTATFSEVVTGFISSDLTLTNCTASAFTPISGTVYTFSITASAPGLVTVSVASNKAQDTSGNQNTASNSYSYTYSAVAPPTVVSSPTTLPPGNTTLGDGSSLVLNAPVTVPSGSTVTLNVAPSQITGTSPIVVQSGGTVVSKTGQSQTVRPGTTLKIKPRP